MADSQMAHLDLVAAITSGDFKRVQEAVKSVPNLNIFLPSYECCAFGSCTDVTPIAIACFERQFKIADFLISKGADLFLIPQKSGTLVIQAVWDTGDHELIRFIIRRMHNLNVPDANGDTPFARVVESNSFEAVKFLVENMNANVCKTGLQSGESPLMKATKNANLDMVKYLMENGAGPSMTTALDYALDKGLVPIAKYFLESGIKIDSPDANGMTYLLKAVEGGYGEILDTLIELKADLDRADSYGNTALHKSIEFNLKSITAKFIKAGANLNLADQQDGKTPFMKIVESGDFVLCKLAVDSGAKIERVDRNGKNALAIAAANGDLLITIYLMKLSSKCVIDKAKMEIIDFAKFNQDFASFLLDFNQEECDIPAMKKLCLTDNNSG